MHTFSYSQIPQSLVLPLPIKAPHREFTAGLDGCDWPRAAAQFRACGRLWRYICHREGGITLTQSQRGQRHRSVHPPFKAKWPSWVLGDPSSFSPLCPWMRQLQALQMQVGLFREGGSPHLLLPFGPF